MGRIRSLLVWIAAAMVVLPLSPCAMACCSAPAKRVEAAKPAKHACCAKANTPAPATHSHSQPGSVPCGRICCRPTSVAPTVKKIETQQPALWTTVFTATPMLLEQPTFVPVAELSPPGPSLQILHCLWRC